MRPQYTVRVSDPVLAEKSCAWQSVKNRIWQDAFIGNIWPAQNYNKRNKLVTEWPSDLLPGPDDPYQTFWILKIDSLGQRCFPKSSAGLTLLYVLFRSSHKKRYELGLRGRLPILFLKDCGSIGLIGEVSWGLAIFCLQCVGLSSRNPIPDSADPDITGGPWLCPN